MKSRCITLGFRLYFEKRSQFPDQNSGCDRELFNMCIIVCDLLDKYFNDNFIEQNNYTIV